MGQAATRPTANSALPTVRTLGELVSLVGDGAGFFVRWSKGPDDDRGADSRDALTGVALPGLSANSLAVEPWWGQRPREVWLARRIYDYRHLDGDSASRAWVLRGRECGRGPDNEPLVTDVEAVAWIDHEVVAEAQRLIDQLNDEWGPLDRESAG
jgi:hypothetical protein